MNDIKNTLKELLETHTDFAVATEPNPPKHICFAREALRLLLIDAGKRIISFPRIPEDIRDTFNDILPELPDVTIPSQIIISIPKKNRLEEIRYDENEESHLFTINPKEQVSISDISLSAIPRPVEAAFLFYENEERFMRLIAQEITLPGRERTVFLVQNHIPLAEKIFQIKNLLQNKKGLRESLFATLLYASLVFETENFQKNTQTQTFELAKNLLSLGAKKDAIKNALERQKNIHHAHLLGRALARSQIDSATSSSWTFLTKHDIEKSGAKDAQHYARDIIEHIRKTLPTCDISFFLWETAENVAGCIYGKDEFTIKPLAQALGKELQDNYFFVGGFENFTRAETKLRELLKDMKYDTII